MPDWLADFLNHQQPEFIVSMVLGGIVLSWILMKVLGVVGKRSNSSFLTYYVKRCSGAQFVFIPILAAYFAKLNLPQEQLPHLLIAIRIAFIVSLSYLLIRVNRVLQDVVYGNLDLDKEDNRSERRIITQINFIKRGINGLIVTVALAVILLSFEEGRKYGAGLLTSAGIVSVIVGFAAQKSIANLLAGIQIAFTQPIRINDAVVVEGEWGWIEEINLTYVVVRIWDWRRLILPITYFVEQPFQNWTRAKAEIIGTVKIQLDHRAPIAKMREKLLLILKEDELWDGNVAGLQVVDTTETTITVRATMSSKNASQSWDLKCNVREKLITFLQEEYPESLPQTRVLVEKDQS